MPELAYAYRPNDMLYLQSETGKQVTKNSVVAKRPNPLLNDSAFATLRQIPDTQVPVEDEEDFILPTPYAVNRAWELVLSAGAQLGPSFPCGTPSATGSGGLRLEWNSRGNSVRLVIPSQPSGRGYIYYEFLQEYGKTDNVSYSELAKYLERLIRA